MTGVFVDTRRRCLADRMSRIRSARPAWLLPLCALTVTLLTFGQSSFVTGQTVQPSAAKETPTAPRRDEPLAEVRIEGNKTIPSSAISKYIKTRAGRPATETEIREDVNSLWGTRWFFSVEPRYRRTAKGLVLVFKVLERPMVRKVEYRGNKKISTKRLIGETGLKSGSPYDVSANRAAARRLERFYHEKGFTFATIKLERGSAKDDRDVIFSISEGPKVKVTSVRYRGNKAFSSGLLRTKLRTSRAILSLFGGRYDPATLPDDETALKQYYHNLGYFDVKVSHKVTFSRNLLLPLSGEKAAAHIEYLVDEGPRYKIRRVEILGNHVLGESTIRGMLRMAAGDYFNARLLNKDVAALKDRYGEQGRLFANVEAVPRYLEQPGVADLVYRIDEDRVYHVRYINIHYLGENSHTKRSVALNRMMVAPGDLANPKKIRLSKSRLGGIQVFERGPANGPRIDVVRVTPKPAASKLQSVRGQSDDEQNSFRRPDTNRRSQRVPTPRRRRSLRPKRLPAKATRRRQSALPAVRTLFGGFVEADTNGVTDTVDRAERAAARTSRFQPAVAQTRSGRDYNIVRMADDDREVDSVFNNGTDDLVVRAQSPRVGDGDPFLDNRPPGDLNGPPPGDLDLDVYLQEARTGRLMFGVGVNSNAGVIGSIILSEQNFDITHPPRSFSDIVNGTAWRGGGQSFRLEAVPGNQVSRYLASWTDPYIFDTDYSLGVSTYFYQRFFRDWDERRGGGRITLGRQLTDTVSIGASLRLESVRISGQNVPTPPSLAAVVGDSFLSTFRVFVSHDTRDSAFLPGEGHKVELSYEQGFGDFNYPRFGVEGRQYFTLHSRPDGGGRQILTLGGQLGWTGSETPIFERYYAGGFQSFRGFAFRGVTPRELDTRVGGRFMFLGSVEYMIPLMASETVQGVVFTDFGSVERNVDLGDFRVTVGAGLRVTVPALGPVPLAFDFAVPVVDQPDDSERLFSFFVGFNR